MGYKFYVKGRYWHTKRKGRENATVRYRDGKDEIYNKVRRQAHGNVTTELEGLNPRELLEASLGLCVYITLKTYIPFTHAKAGS